nr:putative reverse transcriptase domain-containing protein [Tanacetum cinerariifolium]
QKELNMRQRRWIELFSDYECEICYHPSKENVVTDTLSRKEQVKPRHARAIAMTIQSGIRGMIKATQGEAFMQENILAKRLHGLDQQMGKRKDGSLYFLDRIWVPLVGGVRTIIMDKTHKTRYFIYPRADKTYHDIRNLYWWPRMKRDIAIYVSKCLTCSKAEIGESSLIGPELIQETTDKVVLIKAKLKAARDHQKSYADNRCKSLEFEVGDRVMLKVSSWKGVVRFGKKGKLAPRYVGPFEILKRIGHVAYRLRLHEELSGIVTQVTNNVNNANGKNGGNDGNGRNGRNNGCTYKGFMACNPKEYDRKGGAIALTRWIKKMENVIENSGCAENQKVKYAASSFVNKDLTWWNTQVQARGREATIGMSWADFKALLVVEFCPRNKVEKLESEF